MEEDIEKRIDKCSKTLANLNAQIKKNELKQLSLSNKLDCLTKKEKRTKLRLVNTVFNEVGLPEDMDREILVGFAFSYRYNLLDSTQLHFFRQKAREHKVNESK